MAFWREAGLQGCNDIVKGQGVKAGDDEGLDPWVSFDLGRKPALVGGAVGGFYISINRAFNAPFKGLLQAGQIMAQRGNLGLEAGHDQRRGLRRFAGYVWPSIR